MARKKKNVHEEQARQEIAGFIKDHPNVELAGVYTDDEKGQRHYVFKPTALSYLPKEQASSPIPRRGRGQETASINTATNYRDILLRPYLDLAKPDVVHSPPHSIYERMRSYYRAREGFGSYIDVFCDLAIAGFENDCEDAKIKEFYDNWVQDIDLLQVLEWIFLEYWRSGMVRTYKVLGKYEPRVNRLRAMPNPPTPIVPSKEQGEEELDYLEGLQMWEQGSLPKRESEDQHEYAARKKRWSRGFIPLAYTILNPTEIEINGPPDFGGGIVTLKVSDDLMELIKDGQDGKLKGAQKENYDNLPPEFKAGIIKGKGEIELDPDLVGAVNNRGMPYERYCLTPFVRAMEALEYKEAMKNADYSTLDGITSEILIITVGNDLYPVLSDEELQAVQGLFNTVQKSFAVVWNHTLQVKRLPVENIEQIFGTKKFEQAELDISAGLRMPRALIDGVVLGNANKESLAISLKSVTAMVQQARRQVTRWIYNEYEQIAQSYGFDRYPTIRWDQFLLKDELALKTFLQGAADRRLLSYQTIIKELNYDPDYEKKMLTKEAPRVEAGDYGTIGSPYQKGGGGASFGPTNDGPSGVPEGRPKNKQPKVPAPATPKGKTDYTTKTKPKREIKQAASMLEQQQSWTLEDIENMQEILEVMRLAKEKELNNQLD